MLPSDRTGVAYYELSTLHISPGKAKEEPWIIDLPDNPLLRGLSSPFSVCTLTDASVLFPGA